jgi:hypothetical protein
MATIQPAKSATMNVLDYQASITRIYNQNRAVVGAGFLVSSQHLLTCAHVAARALGISSDTEPDSEAIVELDFPLLNNCPQMQAKVVFWQGVRQENSNGILEDVAGLQLEGELPAAAKPVPLVKTEDFWDHSFQIFGFPKGHDDGVWATGKLLARTTRGWVQMENIRVTGYSVEPGFSGSPVWDGTAKGVVGMAVAAEKKRQDVRAAFAIPIAELAEWSVVSDLLQGFNQQEMQGQLRNRVTKMKIEQREKHLEALEADYQAACNQMNYTNGAVERNRIERQKQSLEREMEQIAGEIDGLLNR